MLVAHTTNGRWGSCKISTHIISRNTVPMRCFGSWAIRHKWFEITYDSNYRNAHQTEDHISKYTVKDQSQDQGNQLRKRHQNLIEIHGLNGYVFFDKELFCFVAGFKFAIGQKENINGKKRNGQNIPVCDFVHATEIQNSKQTPAKGTANHFKGIGGFIFIPLYDSLKHFLYKARSFFCHYHGSFPCKFYLILPFLQQSQKQKGLVL